MLIFFYFIDLICCLTSTKTLIRPKLHILLKNFPNQLEKEIHYAIGDSVKQENIQQKAYQLLLRMLMRLVGQVFKLLIFVGLLIFCYEYFPSEQKQEEKLFFQWLYSLFCFYRHSIIIASTHHYHVVCLLSYPIAFHNLHLTLNV